MVNITGSAALKVRELMDREGAAYQGLRLYVAGGGCAGLNYVMAFDWTPEEDDQVIEQAGIRSFVDSYSAPYVKDAEIDYVDGLMGSGFTIHNPNATSTCACGHSFDTGANSTTARSCR